ncbi:MAG TPA: zinc ribbon domain-containing protein [Opitutaceae bacterium]|jgi:putative FmdB family regulatory protein|nr:zinc ribbon domain-containing protein [Opitutaceae bacterium]
MPTYEYACPKCGHQFEQFQSMSAPRLTKCPKCGKPGLKRLVGGGAGLIFKGSGFYITDYKKSSGAKEGGEGGKQPEAKAEAKAEAPKPAAEKPKAEPKK